jgi:hypothetical protein
MEAPYKISSYCGAGSCVGIGMLADGSVVVADTKVAGGPTLTFTPEEWNAFVAGVKASEFDLSELRR